MIATSAIRKGDQGRLRSKAAEVISTPPSPLKQAGLVVESRDDDQGRGRADHDGVDEWLE